MLNITLFSPTYDESLASKASSERSEAQVVTVAATTSEVAEEEDVFEQARLRMIARDKAKKLRSKGVVHNFQHDLESIWWLVLWFITSRVAGEAAQLYGQKIFHNSIIPSPKRLAAFTTEIDGDLKQCLGKLADHFAEPMENIRNAMVLSYVQRVRDSKLRDISSFAPISNGFRTFFKHITESKDKWSATPLGAQNPYIDPAERKRPRPDDDDDAQDENEMEPKSKLPKTSDSPEGQLTE